MHWEEIVIPSDSRSGSESDEESGTCATPKRWGAVKPSS